jgi:protein-disulfide isomerase
MKHLPRFPIRLAIGLCLAATSVFSAPALARDPPCGELAAAVDLSSSPNDDRRQFCQYAKDTVAGGCCQSSLYECLKAHPTCPRGQVLAEIGRGVIATGATEDKAVAAAAAYEDAFAPEKRNVLDTSKAPCKGPKDGVTLAEFSDFDCPHCAAAAPFLQKLLEEDHGVRLCSFTFPLPGHRYSQLASAAALYAESQGKYWEMADALFGSQDERADLEEEGYKAQLLRLGKKIGLDPKGLRAALAPDSAIISRVKDQQMLGISLLIQATPSFLLEGRSLSGIPLTKFEAAIRDERESHGKK